MTNSRPCEGRVKSSNDGGLILVWHSQWKNGIQRLQSIRSLVFRFCRRYGVVLHRKTHPAQKAPEQLRNTITKFHSKILREQKRRKYEDCDFANMDQTPLPFVLDDGKSYDSTGAKEVWCSNASSGLDKRQCTVQLTIFADGVSRARPTIIFRGQGKRISPNEMRSWDSRVNVMFQLKAWCDENVMKVWVER